MTDDEQIDRLDRLADDYLAALRRGERPDIEELARHHADLADRIRDWFPALAELDRLGNAVVPPSQSSPSMPERLGEYRIVRWIGRGGMGSVYEAVQEPLGRQVALKILPAPAFGSANALERFRREARIAARLHHTNIVPVFGSGIVDGIAYYAMQYIDGQPLGAVLDAVRRRFERGADSTVGDANDSESATRLIGGTREHYYRNVARLGIQAAESLAYAHGQGVLHRDVKPSNFLLDSKGTLWIADFGLARADHDDGDLTRTGDLLGTLRYMAPERLGGRCDAAADIFGLGLTLYEMLALRPAFADTSKVSLLETVSRSAPAAPRAIDGRIPRDLETIVLKAIHREPERRYRGAAELGEDLQRFLDGRPILARQQSAGERLRLWAKRNPALAKLGAAFALFFAFVLAAATGAAFWMKGERDAARTAERRAVDAERERTRELYRAYLNEARAARAAGQRTAGLRAIRNALGVIPPAELTDAGRDELREEAGACLIWPDITEREGGAVPEADFACLVADARLETVVLNDAATHWIRRGERDSTPAPLPNGTRGLDRHCSADGRRFLECIMAARPAISRLRVWDFETRTVLLDRPVPCERFTADFSFDGDTVVAAGDDGVLRRFELARAGQPEAQPSAPRFRPSRLAVHPDGRRAAVASVNGGIDLVDLKTWQVEKTIPFTGGVSALAWNPRSRQLAVGDSTGTTHVWDEREDRLETLREQQAMANFAVRFSPDGRWLASCSLDGTTLIRDWHLRRVAVRLDGHLLGFSPDNGTVLVVRGPRWIRYSFDTRGSIWTVPRPSPWVGFSADGRWLATSGYEGVALWSCRDRAPAADLELDDCYRPAFHPERGLFTTVGLFSRIRHWDLRPEGDGATAVGPPREVHLDKPQHDGRSAAWSADGRWLAVADHRKKRVLIFAADRLEVPAHTIALEWNPAHVAIGPDGRLVAAQREHGIGFDVFRADDGRRIPVDFWGFGSATFSPDGRRLVAGGRAEFRVYDTETWEIVRVLPRREHAGSGPAAYARDGRTLALSLGRDRVGLYDAATFRLVMVLALPQPSSVVALAFSPDGGRLAAARRGAETVVWELGEMREELAELGLDWSESAPVRTAVGGGNIRVEFGKATHSRSHWAHEHRMLAWGESFRGNLRDAIHEYSEAIRFLNGRNPTLEKEILAERGRHHRLNRSEAAAIHDWTEVLNGAENRFPDTAVALAKLLVVGPESLRDAPRALALVRATAVEESRRDALDGTVGAALYRVGEFSRAKEHLLRSLKSSARGPEIFDRLFLAAVHVRLGEDLAAAAQFAAARRLLELRASTLDAATRDELERLAREVEGSFARRR